jgi:predicted GIY-YIG superfamily endonuclease
MIERRARTWRGIPIDSIGGNGVYLLHFTRGHPNGRHPRHYLGWSPRLHRRLAGHRSGKSLARYPLAMKAAGIRFRVARVWFGAPVTFEKLLKARKSARRYCPICRPELRRAEPILFEVPCDELVDNARVA